MYYRFKRDEDDDMSGKRDQTILEKIQDLG